MKITIEKPLRKLTAVLLMAFGLAVAHGQQTSDIAHEHDKDKVSNGNLPSLRGLTELDITRKADPFKRVLKDRSPFISDYVYQPPLIPHNIRGYEISTNANKCLSCHSFKRSTESGATKISVTHYTNRDGLVFSDVSPRRYFCLQCHVTQTDTGILVENDFKRVESLR